eukprot:727983-Amphidinium_carterae.1
MSPGVVYVVEEVATLLVVLEVAMLLAGAGTSQVTLVRLCVVPALVTLVRTLVQVRGLPVLQVVAMNVQLDEELVVDGVVVALVRLGVLKVLVELEVCTNAPVTLVL